MIKRASISDLKRLCEKIKVKFSNLGSAAYANIVDNRTTKEKGFVPDATQLTEMQEEINSINSALKGNYVYTSVSSTISFADAFSKIDVKVGNMPLALDSLEKSIANYESGMHSISGGTQVFFVFFYKRTYNTYAGIIMTYYGYNPAFFSRSTGAFKIFVPVNAS